MGSPEEGLRLWRAREFQLVEVPCFYDGCHSSEVRQLFARVLELKLTGYRREYGEGVLPVDTMDFISRHFAVCSRSDGEWVPVMAHRVTSLTQCTRFGLEAPPRALLLRAGLTKWVEHFDCYLQRFAPEAVLWLSSWTFEADRRDLQLRRLFRDLLGVQLACAHRDAEAGTSLTTGTLRFRTERLFGEWGFREFAVEDKPCLFPHPYVAGTPCVLMTNERFSERAADLMETYGEIWRQRIVLGD